MARRLIATLGVLTICCLVCAAENASDSTAAYEKAQSASPSPKLLANTALVADEDVSAEAALLEAINLSRQQGGAAPLQVADSLRAAALAHARLMVVKGQLEHNFPGEPSLLQRIANVSPLPIDQAGENIAYATCAADAAEELYNSPPHRENLLNPSFNIAGIAAVWSHGRLYVVQDFAHEVPSYSARETRKVVGDAIDKARHDTQLPGLTELTVPHLDEAACRLATDDRPNARLLAASYTTRKIVTYTQSEPRKLPPGARRVLADPNVREFAIGSCYARNAVYPTGTYWIAILLN
jgi:uncharacterized protein YkwD